MHYGVYTTRGSTALYYTPGRRGGEGRGSVEHSLALDRSARAASAAGLRTQTTRAADTDTWREGTRLGSTQPRRPVDMLEHEHEHGNTSSAAAFPPLKRFEGRKIEGSMASFQAFKRCMTSGVRQAGTRAGVGGDVHDARLSPRGRVERKRGRDAVSRLARCGRGARGGPV